MSYNLPDDWYIEPTGESLILDQEKVKREIERLRASETAWKLIAKHNDRWNALPQTEKEAALQKALESEVADGCAMTAEIERLTAEIKQCSVELEEAGRLLVMRYPRASIIFFAASARARISIGLPASSEQEAVAADD